MSNNRKFRRVGTMGNKTRIMFRAKREEHTAWAVALMYLGRDLVKAGSLLKGYQHGAA